MRNFVFCVVQPLAAKSSRLNPAPAKLLCFTVLISMLRLCCAGRPEDWDCSVFPKVKSREKRFDADIDMDPANALKFVARMILNLRQFELMFEPLERQRV